MPFKWARQGGHPGDRLIYYKRPMGELLRIQRAHFSMCLRALIT